ncbi:MAG TPA: hypothetical protein VH682_20870, partial [Gemmataceae bacterium]
LSWDCECLYGAGRRRADFKIDLDKTSATVEVKVLCDRQKGTPYSLNADRKKGGLHEDIHKLATTQAP